MKKIKGEIDNIDIILAEQGKINEAFKYIENKNEEYKKKILTNITKERGKE